MRRRLWVLLTGLLLVLVIGDALAWYFATQRLRAGFAEWVAARGATGWSVSTAQTEAGGWPLAATLTLPDFVLQGGQADIPGGLAWRADRVVLRLDLLHPLRLRVDAAGDQRLRVAGAPDIPYTAVLLQLLVPLWADPSAQPLNLHGEGLRARVPLRGATDAVTTLDRLDLDAVLHPTASRGQAAVTMSLNAVDIGLPPRLNWPLGPRIASVALVGGLNGPLPDVIGPEVPGLAARATAWRDGGGSLEVQQAAVHWGPLGLTATASLALDPELQPAGTGTARVSGYAGTLDAMARGGLMNRSAATSAKAVLSLLASAPADGAPAEVEVPLSLRYRTLSMGGMPLVRLPELDWPPQ